MKNRSDTFCSSAAQPGEVAFKKDAYGAGNEVQAHHLIPTAEADRFKQFFQDIADHTDGALVYVQDHPNNGVYLPKDPNVGQLGPNYAAQHQGSHPAYSEFVRGRLQTLQNDYEAKIVALKEAFDNDETDPDFLRPEKVSDLFSEQSQ